MGDKIDRGEFGFTSLRGWLLSPSTFVFNGVRRTHRVLVFLYSEYTLFAWLITWLEVYVALLCNLDRVIIGKGNSNWNSCDS